MPQIIHITTTTTDDGKMTVIMFMAVLACTIYVTQQMPWIQHAWANSHPSIYHDAGCAQKGMQKAIHAQIRPMYIMQRIKMWTVWTARI